MYTDRTEVLFSRIWLKLQYICKGFLVYILDFLTRHGGQLGYIGR